MENTVNKQQHLDVLLAAYNAWMRAGAFRRTRLRCKDFTYGKQWGDLVRDDAGATVTEGELMERHGCTPITNNLVRQLVKSVVGRFRARRASERVAASLAPVYASCLLPELDSRALEEFLISGMAVQRVDVERDIAGAAYTTVENVNLNRFFVNSCVDPRSLDCEIVGQLHDMGISDLIRRVARGDRERGEWVRALYGNDPGTRTDALRASLGADSCSGAGFWRPEASGKCRAVEVWTLESREVLVWHDEAAAALRVLPYAGAEAARVRSLRGQRWRWDIGNVWHCRWLTPMGDLLCEYDSPYGHGSHPFVVKMYPVTDGEVHSLVEDVIGQQKYVNRLVTMLDHMMGASAKGVLLFPVDAVPEGFTWRDIRRVWASSDGVLPFSSRDCDGKPEQIVGKPGDLGAYDMISLQMKLFEYVSGVSGALQGRHQQGNNSSSLYQSEVANGDLALGDIFETFASWLTLRDRKIAATGATAAGCACGQAV